MKIGFDSKKYIKYQEKDIKKRIMQSERIYLEFGGKLLVDGHASRVLPGYDKKTKIKLIKRLSKPEIIYCINAKQIEQNNVISSDQSTYRQQSLNDLKEIKKNNIYNKFVAITRFSGEQSAIKFAEIIKKLGKKVLFFAEVRDYTKNIIRAVSSCKYQPYIPVNGKIIIVTGPASGAGKMSVAMSQLYHEKERGINSSYAKFETFPIHNLPLKHPINLAYEAATANLGDINMIDPYHKKYYKKEEVNYNRDIENFKILQKILKNLTKEKFPFGYKSPTDMGVNKAKEGIVDEEICKKAAIEEIYRRKDFYENQYKLGKEKKSTIKRMNEIIKDLKNY